MCVINCDCNSCYKKKTCTDCEHCHYPFGKVDCRKDGIKGCPFKVERKNESIHTI